jgi:hypothetical protein
MTKEEKKDKEKKRNRDGDKQPGTANPVAVLEAEFKRLKPIIAKHYDWTLLADPCPKKCLDVEFASTGIDDTALSELASQPEALLASCVIFEICVLDYPSGRVLINERVNFLPRSYKLGPIDYLKAVLPKNWERSLHSLSRVHGGLKVTDTPESNDVLQRALRLTNCKSTAEITDMLAAVAREAKKEGAVWAYHGDAPEKQILASLHTKLGAEIFPRCEELNSLALLRTISNHTRYLVRESDPSTKMSLSLGGAYSAITGSDMKDSHTACGDCRGMSRVMTELQQCRQRCESLVINTGM